MTSEKLTEILKQLEPYYLQLVEDLAADDKIETFYDIPPEELYRLMAYKQVLSHDGYQHSSVWSEIEDDYHKALNELTVIQAEKVAEAAADDWRELNDWYSGDAA